MSQPTLPAPPARPTVVGYLIGLAVVVGALGFTAHWVTSPQATYHWGWTSLGVVLVLAGSIVLPFASYLVACVGVSAGVALLYPGQPTDAYLTGVFWVVLVTASARLLTTILQAALAHARLTSPAPAPAAPAALEEQEPKLLALSGYARSGKDTAASHLVAQGWQRIAFADKIKTIAYTENPWVNTNGARMIRLRELVDAGGWDTAKEHDDVRGLLQRLGEAARDQLGEDVWVHAALAEMRADAHVVITDLRYPNELAAIKALGGVTVRIERPDVAAANGHISEHAIGAGDVDVTVDNSADVATLGNTIRAVAFHTPARRRPDQAA